MPNSRRGIGIIKGTGVNGINLGRKLVRIRWLVSLACGVFARVWCKAVEPPVRMVGV